VTAKPRPGSVVVTVPDLPAVEAYHAAVIEKMGVVYWHDPEQVHRVKDRSLADRALARLRRHESDIGDCAYCFDYESDAWRDWPCSDALDAWDDLTDIGTTYRVMP
jgi:hypothetical protein